MAHGITEKDTAWFYNQPAWHGLGKVASTRPKTAKQWLDEAGLAWKVEKDELITLRRLRELARERPKATLKQLLAMASEHALPDHVSVTRVDTGTTLGVVTTTFELFQNVEGFQFIEALLGKTIPETAFSLWEGRQVGALTRIPKAIEIGGDQVRQYIYLRLKHDGTGAVWIFPTNVRVVCANTDSQAVNEAGGAGGRNVFRIVHRGDKSAAIAAARTAMELTIDYGKAFKKIGDRMARQKVAERQLAKVMAELYPTGQQDTTLTSRQSKSREATQVAVRDLFTKGDTQGNSPASKWCLYQALIEHNQHHRSVRASDPQVAAERRFIRGVEDPEGFSRRALAVVQAA